jgi:alkylation response protein AidB-like acyl-CoA dehydrogenase
MKVTTDAVQILGGYGYIKEYPTRNTCAMPKYADI